MPVPSSGPPLDLEVARGASTVTHTVVSFHGRESTAHEDELAVEEPLEIRLAGHSLAVTMRTPGHDEELVAGFLFAERVIASRDDLDVIAHYAGPEDDPRIGNVINVLLRKPEPAVWKRLERNFFTSSACGLCGKATLDAIGLDLPPMEESLAIPLDAFYAFGPTLASAQATFERTGGLHAAGLFDPSGRLLILREDVGRHNAVDKVVGHMLQAGRLPLSRHILMVSGRTSFEIVQKALVARIPVVVSVSAPSSLAVQLALASGMTLVGFLRDGRLNVYTGQHRVAASWPPRDRPKDPP